MDKNTVKVVGIIAAAVIVLGVLFINQMAPDKSSTISSNGVASVKVLPDKVSVNITIDTLDDSADASKDENARISEAVMGALKQIVEEKDIQTEYYNIYEDFDWNEGTRTSRGFKVTNTLKVKTDDFDAVGKIVDAAVDAGATGIDSVNFEISDEKTNELKKEVLEKASKNAREKAEAIAAGLNGKIGDVVSVTTSDYGYMPMPLFRADMAEGVPLEEAVTHIEPKELEVSANVQVTFKLR